jgi:hypothetical protein
MQTLDLAGNYLPGMNTVAYHKHSQITPVKKFHNIGPRLCDDNSTIKVTFEVLLSEEMTFPDSKVVMVFGPPLSDWGYVLVDMKEKVTNKIDNGKYTYLVLKLQTFFSSPLQQK